MNWASAGLSPFAALYGAALAAKNLGYDRGWLRARGLEWPVVSVGNLSVGGAGKTPIVMELARLLRLHAVPVDVLSRGYGRADARRVERVDKHGDAGRYGDEPLLIARGAGVPVYVGASRWAAGRLAEREAGAAGVHLLDDGFQHRELARTVDIVVVHPRDGSDRLLPAGRLREPLGALGRADFLVLREGDLCSETALRGMGLGKPVWRVRRTLIPPPGVSGNVVAFCGIAHPEEFFEGLRAVIDAGGNGRFPPSEHGAVLRDTLAFRDHQHFGPRELERLARLGRGASALLTTEKDFQRLPGSAREQLSAVAPLHAVPLRTELLDSEACIGALLALLTARGAMRR